MWLYVFVCLSRFWGRSCSSSKACRALMIQAVSRLAVAEKKTKQAMVIFVRQTDRGSHYPLQLKTKSFV